MAKGHHSMHDHGDSVILCLLQSTVEPLMNDYKPPGLIKNIYFKHLTFGDAPIKIDNVWVEDEGEEHVMLEVLKSGKRPPSAAPTIPAQ